MGLILDFGDGIAGVTERGIADQLLAFMV